MLDNQTQKKVIIVFRNVKYFCYDIDLISR